MTETEKVGLSRALDALATELAAQKARRDDVLRAMDLLQRALGILEPTASAPAATWGEAPTKVKVERHWSLASRRKASRLLKARWRQLRRQGKTRLE